MASKSIKTLEDVEARLAEIHAEEAPGPARLDPATIALLLSLLVSTVTECIKNRKPAAIADYASRKPLRVRLLLASKLDEAGIKTKDRLTAMRILMKAAGEATPSAVTALAGPILPPEGETSEDD